MSRTKFHGPKVSSKVVLKRPETHERIFWQTVQTKMKYQDKIDSQRMKYIFFFEIKACDPSIYTMDHSDLIASNFMENPIDPKRVKFGC